MTVAQRVPDAWTCDVGNLSKKFPIATGPGLERRRGTERLTEEKDFRLPVAVEIGQNGLAFHESNEAAR
jgi:hypothetical protein